MHNMHLANNMALNAFSYLCAVSKPRATPKKSWLLSKHQRKRLAQNRQEKVGYQVEPPSISSRVGWFFYKESAPIIRPWDFLYDLYNEMLDMRD